MDSCAQLEPVQLVTTWKRRSQAARKWMNKLHLKFVATLDYLSGAIYEQKCNESMLNRVVLSSQDINTDAREIIH